MTKKFFVKGQDYDNVYFMVIDAIGHSKLVENNAKDKVDFAFDEFEKIVWATIKRKSKVNRCQYAESWGWQGDGGLCIFYDKEESRVSETAISSAKGILIEIPHLNNKLVTEEISGEIHVRLAIHKGSFTYRGLTKQGSIHSRQLNLISHAEKVVPSDTLAITQDVHDVSRTLKSDFVEAKGEFENTKFYLYSTRPGNEIEEEWKQNLNAFGEKRILGLESNLPLTELGLVGIFSQRALPDQYINLMNKARTCVWTLGTGLGGFLSDHKEPIIKKKALAGVDIRFLIADPEVYVKFKDGRFALPSWRDYMVDGGTYSLNSGISLITMVDAINREIEGTKSPKKTLIKLKYFRTIPSFAMFRVDSILYFSPYFAKLQGLKSFTIKLREGARLYDQCFRHFVSIWDDPKYSRTPSDVFQGR